MAVERRYTALRQSGGRVLAGVAIRYGDTARLPWGRERFEPGAFGAVEAADVIMNVAHDRGRPIARTGGGGLVLADDTEALTIRATLPQTREADDALELVRSGVLRGLSVEFRAEAERAEGGTRIVEAAALTGLGLVDSGAYPGSTVEARAAATGAAGAIPKNQPLRCKCHAGDCDTVIIESVEFPADRDTLAITGNYARALGSAKRGTLKLRQTDDAVTVELTGDALATPAGRDLAAMAEAVPIYTRPVFDQDASDFTEVDGVAVYSRMVVKAILAGPTDNAAGWPEMKFDRPKRRRARAWL